MISARAGAPDAISLTGVISAPSGTQMTAPQRIVRNRRSYNQWVANEMLADYALRFTAKRGRRWSPLQLAMTACGGISFLALEAIGGAITLHFGFCLLYTSDAADE